MKVTRDVVIDLLPVYFDGEASPDTRLLVEEFFRGNPDFEALARSDRHVRHESRHSGPIPADLTMATILKTKRMIRLRGTLLGISVFMSLLPISFTFDNGELHWGWGSFPAGAVIAGFLAFAAWFAYFRVRGSLHASGV
jgi:hypothetical protein